MRKKPNKRLFFVVPDKPRKIDALFGTFMQCEKIVVVRLERDQIKQERYSFLVHFQANVRSGRPPPFSGRLYNIITMILQRRGNINKKATEFIFS